MGSLESIRWGPENALPSLKVDKGCHWNFCGLLEVLLMADRLAEVIYGRLMGVLCPVGLSPVGNKMFKCSLSVFFTLAFVSADCGVPSRYFQQISCIFL